MRQESEFQEHGTIFASVQRAIDWLWCHKRFDEIRYFDSIISIVWLRRGCDEIYHICNQQLRENTELGKPDIQLLKKAPSIFQVDDRSLEPNIDQVIQLICDIEGWNKKT